MIVIGEKLNGAIPSVAQAIVNRDGSFVRDLARRQLKAGADYLDVCSGTPADDAAILQWMTTLIEEENPSVRFSFDSPNADSILAAIPRCKNPGIVNSVSLEGDKIDRVFGALADYPEWKVIALLLDDAGMPETVEKRMENFSRIMEKAEAYGIAPERLFIDPLVFSIGTSPESFLNFAGAAKRIREAYPQIHVVSGLSNISYGVPSRKTVNRAFLVGAMLSGMDSAIMDPLDRELQGCRYAAEALLGHDEYCIEYISAFRDGLFGSGK